MTVTGLATVNLSGLTGWQQALLYLQMVAGNIVRLALVHVSIISGIRLFMLFQVTVSWIMVIVRKSFFEAKVNHIVQGIIAREGGGAGDVPQVRKTPLSFTKKIITRFFPSHRPTSEQYPTHSRGPNENERLRPDMIRRVAAQPPQLLDPNGRISLKSVARESDTAYASDAYTPNDVPSSGQGVALESEVTAHRLYV